MFLKLFTILALFGLAACSSYGGSNNNAAAAPGYGAYHGPPRHHYRRDHWRRSRSSSSSESDEKWDCARLGVLKSLGTANPALLSAPKIVYYTHEGKEKAMVVCQNPQLQALVGKSRNASPIADNLKDYAMVSVSSNSGITLNCNKRKDRYEAVNLVTFETVPLDGVVCVTADSTNPPPVIGVIVGALHALDGFF